MLLRKRGAPTLCTVHSPRKLPEEPKVYNRRAIGIKQIHKKKFSSNTLVGNPRLQEGIWNMGAQKTNTHRGA